MGIITLTTDFGLSDGYVAAMKGVILSINPEARLIDICHNIGAQDIARTAYILGTTCNSFPQGTIHLVVVDPGVGSKRQAIILRTPSADFVAPDNGVLSYILRDFSAKDNGTDRVELDNGLVAVSLTRQEYWLSPVSNTFHGRDIFAPVAARLSLGIPPEKFGERLSSVVCLPVTLPEKNRDGSLTGQIIHIDGFGNLVTDIRDTDLELFPSDLNISVGGQQIRGLSRTYAGQEGLLALVGSSGRLEISFKNGNAGGFLGIKTGDKVKISIRTGGR